MLMQRAWLFHSSFNINLCFLVIIFSYTQCHSWTTLHRSNACQAHPPIRPRWAHASHSPSTKQSLMSPHTNFPNTQNIDFSLQGRRTLSEQLPPETIKVPITIIARSPHLTKILDDHAPANLHTRTIPLPSVDPAAFKIYISWLETGRIPPPPPSPSSSPSPSARPHTLLLRDCTDLLYAHILGSQLSESQFQDQIIDFLAECLDPAQMPDLAVLQIVFLERGVSGILVKFVVDRMFAVERRMLAAMRGERVDGGVEDGCGDGCKYHGHGEGGCYRRGKQRAKTELGVENGAQRYEKALPALPATPRISSSERTSQSSFQGLQAFDGNSTSQDEKTRTLVSNCLIRINNTPLSTTNTPHTPLHPALASPTSHPETQPIPQSLLINILQRSIPDVLSPPSSIHTLSPHPKIHKLNSASSLPSIPPQPQTSIHQTSTPASKVALARPTIKRKPGSLRGLDWFSQYDRVNPRTGMGTRKGKFREVDKGEGLGGWDSGHGEYVEESRLGNQANETETEVGEERWSALEPDLRYH